MRRRTELDKPSRRAFLATSTAIALGGCLGTAADDSPSDQPESTASPTQTAGATRWKMSVGADPTRPASGTFAYVAAGSTVHAFEHSSGEEVWTYSLPGPALHLEHAGGRLYVVTDIEDSMDINGSDIEITGLDARTGDRQWTTTPGSYHVFASDGDSVFIEGTTDVEPAHVPIASLSAADGNKTWERKLPQPSNAMVDEETLYLATDEGIHALDRASGSRRWRYEWERYQTGTLVVGSDTVAGIEGSFPGESTVHVLDRSGGHRWSIEGSYVAGTTLHEDQLFTGGRFISAYDIETGEQKWKQRRKRGLYQAPIGHGVILSGGSDLQAYDIDTGDKEWTFASDANSLRPATTNDETVYVYGSETNDEGYRHLYGTKTSDGNQKWHLTSEAGLTDLGVGSHGVYVAAEDGTLYALS